MPTKSIFKNIEIKAKEKAERFVKALDKSQKINKRRSLNEGKIRKGGGNDPPRMELPPRPKKDLYSITKDSAIEITQKSREALFQEQREKLYKALNHAADSANYYLDFTFDERVGSFELNKLQAELEDKGFKVKATYGIHDEFEISWYPE